jgi:hypothetical protein
MVVDTLCERTGKTEQGAAVLSRFLRQRPMVSEEPRPLESDEVAHIEREITLYRRWRIFWTAVSVATVPIGLLAGAGGIWAIIFMENGTRQLMMGSVLLALCAAPVWMAFSMRDRGREAQDIVDTCERVDAPTEAP